MEKLVKSPSNKRSRVYIRVVPINIFDNITFENPKVDSSQIIDSGLYHSNGTEITKIGYN